MRMLIAALLVLGVSAPGRAADCPQPAGWNKPVRHLAARRPDMRFALEPNTSTELGLSIQRSVKLATNQGRRGWLNGYAGLAAVDVKKAGKLNVFLSSRAHVDLVRDGQTLQFVDHKRLNCPGLYKVVRFDVLPGRHIVQIADSQARSIRLGTTMR